MSRVRQAPGGNTSICLGADDVQSDKVKVSSNAFANGANQNAGNFITDRSSTGLHAPPGGHSTICLGSDDAPVVQRKEVVGPKATEASVSNTTTAAVRAPPGGECSVSLGSDSGNSPAKKQTSSNAFAQGANQNCGNFITDRPTTGVHAPPGGRSTICLGSDSPDQAEPKQKISSNAFAQGANQNCGNVLTDHPSTFVHAPPGGLSTICLGTSSPTNQSLSKASYFRKEGDKQVAAAGYNISSSGVCLGTDSPTKVSEQKAAMTKMQTLGKETRAVPATGGA